MNWIDTKTIYTMLHIFGVALGAGGAFMSDFMFLYSTKDRILDTSEYNLIKNAGKVVWAGLGLLVVSGALLFSTDPQTYLVSTKFISKMIIVGVIILNGIIFHTLHLKTLKQIVGSTIKTSSIYKQKSSFLYTSGALSITSWIYALILGSLRTIPYSITHILGVYILILLVALTGAHITRKRSLQ